MTNLLTDRPLPSVCRILFNRPEARNAIDRATRDALGAALEEAQKAEDIRAVILGGVGGFFCAGGDLPSMVGLTSNEAMGRMMEGHSIVARLWHYPKPVLIALEGAAVGSGAALTTLADYVVMSSEGRIGFPFQKIGLVPDWGLMATLPLKTGAAVAQKLFREAAILDADQALAINLVDEIKRPAEVMAQTIAKAAELARLPLAAFARMKTIVRGDIEIALKDELRAQILCLTGAEFVEGYEAFRAKRAPDFLPIAMRPTQT